MLANLITRKSDAYRKKRRPFLAFAWNGLLLTINDDLLKEYLV